ncbi:DUF1648 domain-containing protein [Streptomyces sp. NPDC049879]|uniref:DUF1648 domain-containing protein n=1 Tax=Streptomyces sp. NPDC049879 TaxID=3365598 RepID=UPI00379412FD
MPRTDAGRGSGASGGKPDAGGARTARRAVLVAVPFAAALAAFTACFLAWHDRLPDRLATHFTGSGGADDFQSRGAALWTGTGVLLGVGVLLVATVVLARRSAPPAQRWMTALGAGTATVIGPPLVGLVVVNRDAADPADASLPLWLIAVSFAAALAVGALAWLLAGRDPEPGEADAAAATPPLRLAPRESAVWSRRAGSRVLLGTGVITGTAGLVALIVGEWPAGLVLLSVALFTGLLGSVRVTVDRRGVAVASPLLPRPRLRFPLDRITTAGTRDISPLADFGGWGYRIRPGASGVVLRSGKALSLRLRNGREFVVTVDDSATAAALLNGLLEQRRADG